MIEIITCETKQVNLLQEISKNTFIESFGAVNSKKDIQNYLKKAYSNEQLLKELKNVNSKFYLLSWNDEIVGYMKVNFDTAQTEPFDDSFMEIQRIYILSRFQRQGFGNTLIKKALSIAKQNHKKKVWLGVWSENVRAHNFYKNYGFRNFSKHEFVLGSSKQIDLIMVKEV